MNKNIWLVATVFIVLSAIIVVSLSFNQNPEYSGEINVTDTEINRYINGTNGSPVYSVTYNNGTTLTFNMTEWKNLKKVGCANGHICF